jgi:hypothetical protein
MAQDIQKTIHDLAEEARKLLEKTDEEPASKFSKLKMCIPEKTFIYIPKTQRGPRRNTADGSKTQTC